jgi:hypothetical protein
MIFGSVSELNLAMMCAGLAVEGELGFAGNHVEHALLQGERRSNSFFMRRVLPMPINWLNSLPTSSHRASSEVSRL